MTMRNLEEDSDDDEYVASFTPLQEQTLTVDMVSSSSDNGRLLTALCPTMDLLAYVTSTTSNSNTLSIYRTITWQKLVDISSADLIATASSSTAAAASHPIRAVCWSPDGRTCAVGCSPNDGSSASNSSSFVHLLDMECNGKLVHSLEISGSISNMVWSKRIAKPRGNKDDCPLNCPSEAWNISQLYYNDKVDHFLPIAFEESLERIKVPTVASLMNMNHKAKNNSSLSVNREKQRAQDYLSARNELSKIPSSAASLSALSVCTMEGVIHIFLHGRYLAAKIVSNTKTQLNSFLTPELIPDLSSIILPLTDSNLTLVDIPAFSFGFNEFKSISSAYCFIDRQLEIFGKAVQKIKKAWKDSLRPLEMKFIALKSLFKDYDVSNSCVRSGLLNFILIGNSKSNPSSDAIKLFFSNYMPEQGLHRIVKTSESGLASIEEAMRKTVLACVHTIIYATSEMYGHARASAAFAYYDQFLCHNDALSLQKSAQNLCLITEQCITEIVTFRYRLQDLLRWFTGTTAMIKVEVNALNIIYFVMLAQFINT